MKVNLGTFACFCIEACTASDLQRTVEPALRFYERSLSEGSPPPALPRFLGRATGATEELEIASELGALLELEAERQSVELDELVTHAVFVYVAHLETVAQVR
jgi:hypothetical protein